MLTIPTLVIDCPRPGRPDNWKGHWYNSGLNPHFVSGVHGLTWGIETNKWAHHDNGGYKINSGHVGLCLSHWLCWSIALHSGYDEVLICEDDAIFCGEFLFKFDVYRAELPADWQVWYVGTYEAGDAPKTKVTEHLYRNDNGAPFGTHCMLIRRSALPVLMETCQEARLHVDLLIAEKALPHLKWFISHPNLVEQHSANGTWGKAVGGNT